MDNIIIVAGTFYEKHTNRHILYNRQNAWQRAREGERELGNDENIHHKSSFFSLLAPSIRSIFVHVIKEPLEIIYIFRHTQTPKKLYRSSYISHQSFIHITSGVNDEPWTMRWYIALMLVICMCI